MRTVLLGAFLLFTSIFLLTACQKEIDWSIPGSPTPPSSKPDSIMLSKIFLLDTTLPAGLDTLMKVLLEYDNQDRVVKLNRLMKDQALPPASIFHFYDSITFFYNGNDTLPYRLTKATRDMTSLGNDTAFFFYAGGKVIKDSIRNVYQRVVFPPGLPIPAIKVNIFTDNGTTTTMLTHYAMTFNPPVWPPACPSTTVFQKTLDANGNIMFQNGVVTNCGGSGTVTSNHLDFDNKPNPGFDFSIPYPIRDLDLHLSDQKNNITGGWFSAPGDGYQSNYVYRSDGYPLIVRTFDLATPTDIRKGIYIYR